MAGIAVCYSNIGRIYSEQGNNSQALEYYLKALKIQEQIKDKRRIPVTYNNIGAEYQHEGNFTEAMNYFSQH